MGKQRSVAVIGAGVSGLVAGSLLAKEGFKVEVFEANSHIGGCCSTTLMDGYTFNNGAMMVIMPKILDFVFDRIGVDRASVLPLRHISAPQTTFLDNGVAVTLGEQLEIKFDGSKGDADQARCDLEDFLSKWEPLYKIFSELMLQPFSLPGWLARIWKHAAKLSGNVSAVLGKSIRDENLRTALTGHIAYAGIDPKKLPAPSVLALVAMLKEGYFLPEGGMGQIPLALANFFENAGGEIRLNARVKQIKVRDGRVAGLEVEGVGFVNADVVISSVSGMLTFGNLIDSSVIPGRLKRKVAKAPLSMRAFTIQIGTVNQIASSSHINYILPAPANFQQYFAPGAKHVKWGFYSIPTAVMPELSQNGGSIIEFGPAIPTGESLEAWDEEKIDHVANASFDLLSKYHKLQIATKRIRSPRHFRDDMNLHQGAIYGLSPTAGPLGLFSHKTPINGLYLTGQTTYPGFGVTPAAFSGILTVEPLLE